MRGCYPLARSGRVMHAGSLPAGAIEAGRCECGGVLYGRPGHKVEGKPESPSQLTAEQLAQLRADTTAEVHQALADGDRHRANKALRHAVHKGVAPVDMVAAFLAGDQPVEPGDSGGPVGADVPGDDLPSETVQLGEGQRLDSDHVQADKPTPRRRGGKKAEDSSGDD